MSAEPHRSALPSLRGHEAPLPAPTAGTGKGRLGPSHTGRAAPQEARMGKTLLVKAGGTFPSFYPDVSFCILKPSARPCCRAPTRAVPAVQGRPVLTDLALRSSPQRVLPDPRVARPGLSLCCPCANALRGVSPYREFSAASSVCLSVCLFAASSSSSSHETAGRLRQGRGLF